MAHKCKYDGKTEKCVGANNTFPVTKNGKIDCNRVRNALARARQFGHVRMIIKGGIRAYVKRCKIESSVV